MSNKCSKCKCDIVEERDICRICYGSGESDDPMDFYGCFSCKNGEVVTWHCDCDPYEEAEND